MRTFILTKAYELQLGNSKANDEKAKYLLDLVREFDKRQETKIIHELKTLPEYFEKVFMGKKNFEIRQNDRGFKVGDFVELQEYDLNKGYTGRKLSRQITYIFKGGSYGLAYGYVVMAID